MCLQGRGVDPDQHVRLGCLPKLTSYCAHDVLELSPPLLQDILSLQALKVQALVVTCRLAAACLL